MIDIETSRRLFDAIRSIVGRPLKQAEVDKINDALADPIVIDGGTSPNSDWRALAIPLMHEFEGYAKDIGGDRVQAYPDPATGGAPWTIGYGTTGPDVAKGAIWSRKQAEERFASDLAKFANGVDALIYGVATTPAQKAAMVSLAYNIGLANFKGSTLLKKHKAGDYVGAADQFAAWRMAAGKVMQGLVRRRAAEAKLYKS